MTRPASVAVVLVSHSEKLAEGLADVASEMAPNVRILPAGGTDAGGIGTSYEHIEEAITRAREGGQEVLVLSDLGSATMTAEAAIEACAGGVQLADVPFVEGAVSAAVAAQGGGDLASVHAAARSAIESFAPSDRDSGPQEVPSQDGGVQNFSGPEVPAESGEPVTQQLTLKNKLGLHARPAAVVARTVAEYEAQVTINGVDASSVLALMGLALPGGAEVELSASGADAPTVMQALVPQFEEGFGEE